MYGQVWLNTSGLFFLSILAILSAVEQEQRRKDDGGTSEMFFLNMVFHILVTYFQNLAPISFSALKRTPH